MSGSMLIASPRKIYITPRHNLGGYQPFLMAAWAAASRAMGTRKGEQDT